MSRLFSVPRPLLGALLVGVLVIGQALSQPAHAGIEEGADAFVRSLADKAIQSLTEADVARAERVNRFRVMFKENFAVRSIGKFVLGRYWRRASDDEKQEYFTLFEDLMVVTYVDRFQRYAGEALKVSRARAETETIATVFSEIERPGGAQPIRVDWRVGTNGTIFKILDVIVEGTSMSNTLRSDFGSIVRREGGKVAGLLVKLREKTAALKAENTQ